jgi:hypothetical protein
MRRDTCVLGFAIFFWVATTVGVAAVGRGQFAQLLKSESEQLLKLSAVVGNGFAGDRISGEFAGFAGSIDNADDLVSGLRRGVMVALATARGGAAPEPVYIPVPTPPMDNVDIYLSLAFARQRLREQGIAAPTPDQIKAALIGDVPARGDGAADIARPGVLAQRRQGLDWLSIARADDRSLEAVLESMHGFNRDLAIFAAHLSGTARAFSTGQPDGTADHPQRYRD